MTHDQVRTFADEWAAAWNALDVERVLAHFHDEVAFTSPTAQAVVGVATVKGKVALRDYWQCALAQIGLLRFAVDRVLWDASTRELAIVYVSDAGGRRRRISENLTFDAHGSVVSAEVFHGVDA